MFFWVINLGGCGERQIITPTIQMNAEPQYWIRVLLFEDIENCTLKIPSGFNVINEEKNQQSDFSQIDAPINVKISQGLIYIAASSFEGKQIIISPQTPYVFNINGNNYRGNLKFIINSADNSFDVINLVPVESYLAGVVGAEMPNYWEMAALKAQAVAARTYCLYIKRQYGNARHWDVRKTQASQVYAGIKAESARVWQAVKKTNGQVLIAFNKLGTQDLFPAFYSSTCGGHTENSQNVFGGDFFEPLAGVPCPYCKYVAKPKHFFWPMVTFNKNDVSKKLLNKYPKLKVLGEIIYISPAKLSNYKHFSRMTSIKLTGSTKKTGFVRAEDLRLTIDPTGNKMKSSICNISDDENNWVFLAGRGYGHGVGMCQCGAQGMARKGKKAIQILTYYYPNSAIKTLY